MGPEREACPRQSDRVTKGGDNKHLWGDTLCKVTVPDTGVKERVQSVPDLGG